jgi:hypothetical protein
MFRDIWNAYTEILAAYEEAKESVLPGSIPDRF